MFTFLSRLGRLTVTIGVLVAVAGILGFTTFGMQLVASHHGASASAACVAASAGVGKPLVISGHGFAANSQYLLYTNTPAGSGATTATTDGSGSFTVNSWAYWAGTYGRPGSDTARGRGPKCSPVVRKRPYLA